MTYRSLTTMEFMKFLDHELNRCIGQCRLVPVDVVKEAQRRMIEMEMSLHDVYRIVEEYDE